MSQFITVTLTRENSNIDGRPFPFEQPIMEALPNDKLIALFAVANSSYLPPEVEKETANLVRELGYALYATAFPTEAAALIAKTDGPIALKIDDLELSALPWELLYDKDSFLARSRGIFRLLKTEKVLKPETEREVDAVRILAAFASPIIAFEEDEKGNKTPLPAEKQPGRIDVEEAAKVFEDLRGQEFPAQVQLLRYATVNDIRAAFNHPGGHVLHFVGHGLPDSLLFQTRWGEADSIKLGKIRDLFHDGAKNGLRLVVLNSCLTAREYQRKDQSGKIVAGVTVARTVAQTGIPAVVAMQWPVSSRADHYFANAFYAALSRNHSPLEAVRQGRAAIYDSKDVRPWEWATPVLYLNQDWLDKDGVGHLLPKVLGDGKVRVEPPPRQLHPMLRRDQQFVGRGKELYEIGRNLDFENSDGAAVTALVGTGGIGKTALSVEAVHRYEAWFDDIVFVSARADAPPPRFTGVVAGVPLETVKSETEFAAGLARALGLTPQGTETVAQLYIGIQMQLNDDRKRLLILDNLETLAQETTTRTFLTQLPQKCKALVTSRHRIDAGEVEVQVLSLKEIEALTLLVQQAGLHQVELSDPDIVRVIKAAGGHPLTLKLAVSLVRNNRVKDLRQLAEDLSEYKGSMEEITNYVFAYSLDKATNDERLMFRVMAIFSPNCDRNALQAASGLDDDRFGAALEGATGLSLIESYENGGILALQPLAIAPAATALNQDRRRNQYWQWAGEHFLDLAERGRALMDSTATTKYAREELGAHVTDEEVARYVYEELMAPAQAIFHIELLNMIRCAEWCHVLKRWPMVVDFYDALEYPLDILGYWAERRQLAVWAIEAAEKVDDKKTQSRVLHNAGIAAQQQGDYAGARQYYHQSLEIDEALGDRAGVASSYLQLGNVAHLKGNYEAARQFYQHSLEIKEAIGDRPGISESYHGLANVAYEQGNYDVSKKYIQESLNIKETLGDRAGISHLYHQLGILAQAQGDYAGARQYYHQSLEIAEALGDRAGVSKSYHQLGMLEQAQGDYAGARQYYHQSLEINEALGDRAGVSSSYHQLGMLAQAQGDYAGARQYYHQSLEIKEALGDRAGAAQSYGQIGNLARVQGNFQEAENNYQKALTVFKELGDLNGLVLIYSNMAECAILKGAMQEAIENYANEVMVSLQFQPKAVLDTLRATNRFAKNLLEKNTFQTAYQLCGTLAGVVNKMRQEGHIREGVSPADQWAQEVWAVVGAFAAAEGNPTEEDKQRLLQRAKMIDQATKGAFGLENLLTGKKE